MNKNYLHLLLIFIFCMYGKSVSAYDTSARNADGVMIYYNYINNGTELEVTFQSPYHFESCVYSGDMVIPEKVTLGSKTLKVTRIGDKAFAGCSYNLTSVTIPNSVTSIGNYAFLYCYGLTTITLPNSVTDIGEGAFDGCDYLTSVYISDIETWCRIQFGSLTSNPVLYAGHLYVNGEEINELVIPNSVTCINNYTFANQKALTSVIIPNSVTSIGECAFYICEKLTSVTMGNSVASIGEEAFYCCEIESIDIPSSMTTIGRGAFKRCGLTSVNIPNSVTTIEDEAFGSCYNLSCIDIPNSVTTIGQKAFKSCYKLTSVKIGSGVTCIQENAFEYCNDLKSVDITDIEAWCRIQFGDPESNPITWTQHLYLNGEEITDLIIPEGITSINDYAFYYCWGLTSVTIPEGVTSINDNAFWHCKNMTSIIIPNSVTSIGNDALEYCYHLTNIYCYAEQVPTVEKTTFYNSNCGGATLHVPAAAIDAYKNAEQWKDFGNIVALTDDDPKPTEIEVPKATQQSIVVEIYDLGGRCISQLQRGLNIVKMSDGTIKKIIVK